MHVGIIMDGNGRWATARGWPRVAGHRAGVAAVRRAVEAAPGLGIRTLTLYAFSADNWGRPAGEVRSLFRLFRVYLLGEVERCIAGGVRLRVIGRRDRLPAGLVAAIERAERATSGGRTLDLRLAVDYSGREAILTALRELPRRAAASVADVARLSSERQDLALGPDVDLLIRSGGEQRLSDFMLWEAAYAELLFTPRMWPEFEASDLAAAVQAFRGRERRFGRLPLPAAS